MGNGACGSTDVAAAMGNGACGSTDAAAAMGNGACGSMGAAAAINEDVAPDLYLGSNESFRPTEGHSFSMPPSNLTSHFFSPQDSTMLFILIPRLRPCNGR
jgi:hypothetical protein